MPKEYTISHITDLCNVDPEHLDEVLHDMKCLVASLLITKAALEAAGQKTKSMSALCPSVTFVADGKGEVVMQHDQLGEIFTMRREMKP